MPKRRSYSVTSQESYSAVIIADLVAEVPDGHEHKPPAKQETNLGFEGDKAAAPAAVMNVDSTETVVVKPSKKKANSTDISQGVILNAMRIVQDGDKETGDEIETLPMENAEEEEKEEEEAEKSLTFKEMSRPRKIAFITSFLPSIFFVLCFTVIFPCNKTLPCVQDQWSVSYNGTDMTSKLKIQENLLFGFVNEDGTGVKGIRMSDGKEMWETRLQSAPLFIECGPLLVSGTQSCLVMDENSTLYILDPNAGDVKWTKIFNETENTFRPTIVPDCNNDGIDEIAVAVSKSEILIYFDGNETSFTIPECDSFPYMLTFWNKGNETDLLLTCQKGENEVLLKIPQSHWCNKKDAKKGKVQPLLTTKVRDPSHSSLLSNNNGLLIWAGNNARMLDRGGKQKWMVSNKNHSSKNRFVFHGKFSNDNEQTVLISSDISESLQVTRINPETGEILKTTTEPNTEVLEAVLIHGEKQDFILVLKRKITKSLANEAVSQINEMSSTVISLLAKEEFETSSLNTTSYTLEEVSLMDFDGKDIQTMFTQKVSSVTGYPQLLALTVTEEKTHEHTYLKVYISNKHQKNSSTELITTLRSLKVKHWDISSNEISQCVWN